jgi:hypothetical protein
VRTDRAANVRRHRDAFSAVAAALGPLRAPTV